MDLKEDAMWKMAEKMGMPKSAIEAVKAKQKNGDKSAMPDMGKMMSMLQAMKGEKKDEMRKMLTPEFIAHNIACFKKQMSRFIDFGEDKAIIVNNADWLLDLNYVQLLHPLSADGCGDGGRWYRRLSAGNRRHGRMQLLHQKSHHQRALRRYCGTLCFRCARQP